MRIQTLHELRLGYRGRNIAENLNRLSRAHKRYRRQTTDDRQADGRHHIANVNVNSRSLKTDN